MNADKKNEIRELTLADLAQVRGGRVLAATSTVKAKVECSAGKSESTDAEEGASFLPQLGTISSSGIDG